MALNYVTLGGHHAGRAEEHGYAKRHAAMSCQKGVRLFFYFVHVYIFMSVLKITWKIVSSTQNLKLDLMRKK